MQYKGLLSGLFKEIFGKLTQKIDLDKEWPMKPVIPSFNAAYQPGQNSISKKQIIYFYSKNKHTII